MRCTGHTVSSLLNVPFSTSILDVWRLGIGLGRYLIYPSHMVIAMSVWKSIMLRFQNIWNVLAWPIMELWGVSLTWNELSRLHACSACPKMLYHWWFFYDTIFMYVAILHPQPPGSSLFHQHIFKTTNVWSVRPSKSSVLGGGKCACIRFVILLLSFNFWQAQAGSISCIYEQSQQPMQPWLIFLSSRFLSSLLHSLCVYRKNWISTMLGSCRMCPRQWTQFVLCTIRLGLLWNMPP